MVKCVLWEIWPGSLIDYTVEELIEMIRELEDVEVVKVKWVTYAGVVAEVERDIAGAS